MDDYGEFLKQLLIIRCEEMRQLWEEYEKGTDKLRLYRENLSLSERALCSTGNHKWDAVCNVRPWTSSNFNSMVTKECYRCGRLEPL